MNFGKLFRPHDLLVCTRLCFLLIIASLSVSCSTEPSFHRVEEFPEGMNTDQLASATHTRLHTTHVSNRYQAGFDEVWDATVQVAKNFEKHYGQPILHINKKKKSIYFSETNLFDRKKMPNNIETERLRGWKEQVKIKVRSIKAKLTKVTVYRTVEGMVYYTPGTAAIGFGVRSYQDFLEPEISNGEIEDWFLTKIEDQVADPSKHATLH